MIVCVRTAHAVLMRFPLDLDRNDDELAVPDATLGNHVLAQMSDGVRLSTQQCHLEAAVVIEVDAGRRHHQVVVVRACLREPLGELSHVTVVDVDEGRDADLAGGFLLRAELLVPGPDDVAERLGAAFSGEPADGLLI
jgi:hypothetical protein